MIIRYHDINSQEVKDLVAQKKSFEIVGLSGKLDSAAEKIESIVESFGYSCRVYTYGRVAVAGAGFFSGIAGVIGAAAAVGIAAHNLATYNPDYEIAKHVIDNKLSVSFKK